MLWHYPQKYTVVSVTGSPFCLGATSHMNRHTGRVCPLPGPSICHSAANQHLQRLTLNHTHCSVSFLPPPTTSPGQEATSESTVSPGYIYNPTKTVQICQLMFLRSPCLLCGVKTSRDVTTFIRRASAGASQGSPLMDQPA